MSINILTGLTLQSTIADGELSKNNIEVITFNTTCGRKFEMLHNQQCCENVYLNDIVGDLEDLQNAYVVSAEEVSNEVSNNTDDYEDANCSRQWTYYNIQTSKGHVQLRWIGESNGFYSISVDFSEI